MFYPLLFLPLLLPAFSQTVPATTTTLDTAACTPPHDAFPFCNTALSLDERVNDLIARVWAQEQEKIPLLLTARNMGANNLSSLFVPEFDYGLNCIHGVQSSCVLLADGVTTVCPTSFMNPVNFGNAWNKSLAFELGAIIGVETRALWLLGAVEQSARNHVGLDTWSPNINVNRDPRWGRGQEVPSEDPLLNGDFGESVTVGLQQGVDPRYLQTAVTLKHWAAYSLEDAGGFTRHNFDAEVSPYALSGTYFPAFRQSVKMGGATGVMCAYNSVQGIPSCASPLLTHVLRDVWGFQGYVTSDSGGETERSAVCLCAPPPTPLSLSLRCAALTPPHPSPHTPQHATAIEDIYSQHHYTNDSLSAIPVALRDGQTDVCSGNVYKSSLLPALAAGLVTREDVDLALAHTFKLRMRMGLFDPTEGSPYWHVSPAAIGAPSAQATNLLATRSSMVLLKHDGKTLPFAAGKRIAVIGPHGNATMALVGNYLGQLCPDNKFDCIVSPFAALTALNVGGSTTLTEGCPLTKNDTSGFAAALAAAAAADYVVLALGIDLSVEGEGHDRTSIDLPSVQHALAAAVVAVGRPTAVVLLRGGVVDVSAEAESVGVGAIIDAGYPGFLGGRVIAETLMGLNDHLGGKLAQTMYKEEYCGAMNMTDMEVDTGVGRGYRFFTGTPLYPFGFGLSLTLFSLALASGPANGALTTEAAPSAALVYTVRVTNTGAATGDEVVQAYFSPLSTPAQPRSKLRKQLFGYQRVHLMPGESTDVAFSVTSETLRLVDRDTGSSVSTPGSFDIIFTDGGGQILHNAVQVSGEEVVVKSFPF